MTLRGITKNAKGAKVRRPNPTVPPLLSTAGAGKVRLGEVCEIAAGQGAPQGDAMYSDVGTPFIKAGDLSRLLAGCREREVQKVTESTVRACKLKLQPSGSLLFAKSGMSCMKGYVYRLRSDCYVVSHLAIIKPSEKVCSVYLEHCFRFNKPNRLVKDPAYPSISLADISDLVIPLPPLPTQQRIADELDQLCALKKNAEDRLAILDQIVKSRFVEMFGDPFANSKGFRMISLSQLISHANNGMTRRGKDSKGQIVLRIVELRDGFIDYSNPNRIYVNEKERERYLLVENDFLFVRVNGNPDYVGRCAYFKDIGEPVFHNDHIIRVRFSEDVDPTYMSTILNGRYGKKEIRDKLKTSAGQYTINQDGIGAINVPLPPLSLQREFAAFVTEVDKSKVTLRETVATLDQLYRAKLKEYFG